ncbi:MAG: hypothetical protein JWO13_1999 [Acidobacteriales bacterium]|nr:hypothetical protein [Terriglobales bacterium]
MRVIWIVLLALIASARAQSFETTVDPISGETFAGPCHYQLTLPAGSNVIRAVWVTFDRGRDITRFYSDSDVIAFAQHHDVALMLAHQCNAKSAPGGPEEMDMDPSHGVGRALFTALEQFAEQSRHTELSTAKLILLGFSGTGALFAHFVGYAPDRIVASILANPGHFDPVGVDNVQLPASGLGVPELIIVGGADNIVGSQRPYNYFRKYRDRSAPWAFVVQNKTPHCCVINAEPLILAWLDEIIKLRQPSWKKQLLKIDDRKGWIGNIRKCVSDVHDTWDNPLWNACDASIQLKGQATPTDEIPAGWFPSQHVASAWLEFIKQTSHPTTSRP